MDNQLSKEKPKPTWANPFKSEDWTVSIYTRGFAVAAVLFGIYAFHFLHVAGLKLSKSAADWGAAGDFFGGFANPLISLITLSVLVAAYRLQRKELAATVAELKAANEGHSELRRISIEQNKVAVQKALNDALSVHMTHLSADFQLQLGRLEGLRSELRALAAPNLGSGSGYHNFTVDGIRLVNERMLSGEIARVRDEMKQVEYELQHLLGLMQGITASIRSETGKLKK
ncbi:hypothetical protein [Kordiimonas gwangyangensis]|uniref:hypothetical protein n=1 Tax=Kordiimonas gwangyangensis TaxID=288022 RepID=UPI00046F40B8|nr:hypothetical protein [Kordiimonas gwangyangensis]